MRLTFGSPRIAALRAVLLLGAAAAVAIALPTRQAQGQAHQHGSSSSTPAKKDPGQAATN